MFTVILVTLPLAFAQIQLSNCPGGSRVGGVECRSDQGWQCYQFTQGPEQRAFCVYTPATVAQKAPIVLHMDCYAGESDAKLTSQADHFGFRVVVMSTPYSYDETFVWRFGNDGRVNASQPMPCSDASSPDIAYSRTVIEQLKCLHQPSKFYTEGFSRNSMFAAYVGFSFPEDVHGIFQMGAGAAIAGKMPDLPDLPTRCTTSSWEKYGEDCRDIEPCSDCDVSPILPCFNAGRVQPNCLLRYTNDDLIGESSKHMYDLMKQEGGDARWVEFPPQGDQGKHLEPAHWEHWLVGCLGISEPCTQSCEKEFSACTQTSPWSTCNARLRAGQLGCAAQCALTLKMLNSSWSGLQIKLSQGRFGARSDSGSSRPSSSVCRMRDHIVKAKPPQCSPPCPNCDGGNDGGNDGDNDGDNDGGNDGDNAGNSEEDGEYPEEAGSTFEERLLV